MTWREALADVVAKTGHARFEWLCSDDNPDAEQREGYRRVVLEWDVRPTITQPHVPHSTHEDEWSPRIRACPDYNPGCCASPLPFCSRFLIHPSRERCIECLTPPPTSDG